MANILLIDDDSAVLHVLGRILKGLGHRVSKAGGAEQALALLREPGHFDLAVADLILPSMSGLELAKRIRAKWPSLPMIAISGYASTESIWTLMVLDRLGITGVLQKPVDRRHLKAALKRNMGQRDEPSRRPPPGRHREHRGRSR